MVMYLPLQRTYCVEYCISFQSLLLAYENREYINIIGYKQFIPELVCYKGS